MKKRKVDIMPMQTYLNVLMKEKQSDVQSDCITIQDSESDVATDENVDGDNRLNISAVVTDTVSSSDSNVGLTGTTRQNYTLLLLEKVH